MTTYPRTRFPVNELQTGDTVRFDGIDGFQTAIVKQVTDKEVTFFRPYGTTADFEYTGGVICYVGVEEFSVARVHPGLSFMVLQRRQLQ